MFSSTDFEAIMPQHSSGGCPGPATPDGPHRSGQAPPVETSHGAARFCPGRTAAVRVAGDPDSCPTVEWTDGDTSLTLADPRPAVVARFREYSCPEYALSKWLKPQQYKIRRRRTLK